jgi:regulator of protease activity HflC (stomatin/prohibitin superfamily)
MNQEAVDEESIDTTITPCYSPCELFCLIFQNLLFLPILPLYLGATFVIVHPKEAVIMTAFGKIRRVIKEPGCYWHPLLNCETISTKVRTSSIKGSSVPDLKGAPMNVSAIVNFKIVDPIKCAYEVNDYQKFIDNQSLEVLRTTCAKFAYRTDNLEPCLMTDSSLIGYHMALLL